MSTIKVNAIKNTSTDDGGIAIDNSGHVQIDGQQLPTTGALSNRNLIINGAMSVAQRGTSFTVTDAYTLDRYKFKENTAGAVTVTQSSTAPDGFSYSLKVDVTTADTSMGSTDHGVLMYHVEGYNFAQANFGSSAAKKVTLSFWVRSNKTGTYGVALQNNAQNRARVKEYTISSADTWEHKTITLDGDTAGTWLTTNGTGGKITWGLAGGSTYATSDLSNWKSSNLFLTSNQVNLFDSTSNEWYLTGVQLEVGEKATPFEYRSYGDELAKCQRYFYKIGGDTVDTALGIGAVYSSTQINVHLDLPCAMRTKPSATTTGSSNWLYVAQGATSQTSSSSVTIGDAGDINLTTLRLFISSLSSLTAGNAVWCLVNSNHSLDFSAEL